MTSIPRSDPEKQSPNSDPLTPDDREFTEEILEERQHELFFHRGDVDRLLRIIDDLCARLAPLTPPTPPDAPFRVGDRVLAYGEPATVDAIDPDGVFGLIVVRWDRSGARGSLGIKESELALLYDAPQPPAAPERDAPAAQAKGGAK